MLIKTQKRVRKMKPNPYFSNWNNNYVTCFLVNSCHHNNSHKLLLFNFIFGESFIWIFNCSLWVRYPSLGTHYYLWHYVALVVKNHRLRSTIWKDNETIGRQVSFYWYRWGYTRPLLKCITPNQDDYVMREIDEGVLGSKNNGCEGDGIGTSLLWILGGLRKFCGLLMEQGPPRRCDCLGGAWRVGI